MTRIERASPTPRVHGGNERHSTAQLFPIDVKGVQAVCNFDAEISAEVKTNLTVTYSQSRIV